MKNVPALLLVLFIVAGCSSELVFDSKKMSRKTSLPCREQCPEIKINIPIASNGAAADSINATLFESVSEIVHFGEEESIATTYEELLESFIASYEKLQSDAPDEIFGWEANVDARVAYESDQVLNVEIKHYTFTGGAHGYSGLRSLLFDPRTGMLLSNAQIFKNVSAFEIYAEKRFRNKFKIPEKASINSQGMMFENDRFHLPQNIFFTDQGLLLYYNAYEIASYAEGAQELLLPYNQIDRFLQIR